MIDEFIYQFNSFCSYRQRVALKSDNEEELQLLRDNPNTWGCYSVLNVLYSLIQRSQISEQLAAMKRNEDPSQFAGDYGNRPLYKMLGYFSIIGLLRVHCLLGDFSLALKTLDDIELNKKAMFARVMAAHFTTYYYVGFSYMMMRRYADAIRMFSHILVYVSRTKNFQKNAQYDSITKKNDQMYALIAICVAFHPTRLDDTIHTALREKYGEQFNRMQRGGPDSLPLFEELFRAACPKFISPSPPDFDNPEINVDPIEHHLRIFMEEVKNNMWSPTVKSYLKLYTTMDLKKLAGFLEVEPDRLRHWLLVNKQRSRQVRWSEGGLLEGDVVNSSDLDYAMQGVSTPSLECIASLTIFRTSYTCQKQRWGGDSWTGICAISPGPTKRYNEIFMRSSRVRKSRVYLRTSFRYCRRFNPIPRWAPVIAAQATQAIIGCLQQKPTYRSRKGRLGLERGC